MNNDNNDRNVLIDVMIDKPITRLNALYHTNRHGKFYKSREAKEFERFMKGLVHVDEAWQGKVRVEVEMRVRRDCDIDSRLKVLLDALENIVYLNDSQIYELIVTKQRAVKGDVIGTRVKVTKLDVDAE